MNRELLLTDLAKALQQFEQAVAMPADIRPQRDKGKE